MRIFAQANRQAVDNQMNRIFYFLTLAAIIATTACGSSSNNTGSDQNTDTGRVSGPDSVIQHYVQYLKDEDTATGEAGFEAQEVLPAEIGKTKILRGKHFDQVAALKGLFPGTYMKAFNPANEQDSLTLSAWVCKDCRHDTLSGWYGEDSASFPYEEGNITRAADTLMYVDDAGRQNVIVSFSSVRLQDPEFMSSGRFICAVLGLAWYTYEQGQWALKSFSPQLGCYGSFQTLPDLHLIKLGRNNFGCYFLNTNGGAGGPFYSDLYVYASTGDRFRLVMSETGVKRSQFAVSGWDMHIDAADNGGPYGDIQLAINGAYDKKGFEEEQDDEANMPIEMRQLAKTKGNFRFIIRRQYKIAGSMYKQTDTKSDIE